GDGGAAQRGGEHPGVRAGLRGGRADPGAGGLAGEEGRARDRPVHSTFFMTLQTPCLPLDGRRPGADNQAHLVPPPPGAPAMKLGLINSAWAQAGRDTAFGIRMTKEIGFDSLDVFADPLDVDARERRLIRTECARAGLPVVSVACVAV